MLQMVAQTGPARDPLYSKLDGKHLTKTLEIAEKRIENEFELRKLRQVNSHKTSQNILKLVCGLSLVGFATIWLFLAYGKTDQVFQLVAMLFVGGGGVGIGTAIRSRREEAGSIDGLGSRLDQEQSSE